jgi:hypothetical protein
MTHEGLNPMTKAKIDMLEGQLNRFVMLDDEITQDMFNLLKKLVNEAKTLGSKKWTDRMLTEHMMRAYTLMNYNMVALIHQDPAYKRMSSDDVLGRIMNYGMYIEKAIMSRTSPKASLPQGSKKLLLRQTRRARTSKR